MEFQRAFDCQSSNITQNFIVLAEKNVSLAASFTVSFPSSVTNFSWPNVTLPDFEELYQHEHQPGIAEAGKRDSREAYASDADSEKMFPVSMENAVGENRQCDIGKRCPHRTIPHNLWRRDLIGRKVDDAAVGLCAPFLLVCPHNLRHHLEFFELFDDAAYKRAMEMMINTGSVTLSEIPYMQGRDSCLKSVFFIPMHTKQHVVGVIALGIDWSLLFQEVTSVQEWAGEVPYVIENTCGEPHEMGRADMHDSRFNIMRRYLSKYEFPCLGGLVRLESLASTKPSIAVNGSFYYHSALCDFSFSVYPTAELESSYANMLPIYTAIAVSGCFLLSIGLSFLCDMHIQGNVKAGLLQNVEPHSIVHPEGPRSIPARIHSSCFQQQGSEISQSDGIGHSKSHRLKQMVASQGLKVIADLFPNTTVMHADVSGVSAWSSGRDQQHVFQLLAELDHAFDVIANRLGVYKVETMGDCCVAVAGLHENNPRHAVNMALYALECLAIMRKVIIEMEVTLGPGTAELGIRIGLHSGPVFAGFYSGKMPRNQSFGDEINTPSMIESSSSIGNIKASQETVKLISGDGKANRRQERPGLVPIKGNGILKTYWVDITRHCLSHLSPCAQGGSESEYCSSSQLRMWASVDMDDSRLRAVDVLSGYLEKVVSRRLEATGRGMASCPKPTEQDFCNIFDEVNEIIALPPFDPNAALKSGQCAFKLPREVKLQLRVFVATIASLYKCENPFHNFEHACHVLMSASKLINCIVSHDGIDSNCVIDKDEKMRRMQEHHDSTFGISSDPLAHFAIMFSVLIHDVEHPGVTNLTLIDEKSTLATKFKNRSVAEQNSVVVAWGILMQEQFIELRDCIFSTIGERQRFRQLVVNSVMATDIMDRDLQELRKKRWAKAFAEKCLKSSSPEDVNRKATIVIEHIMQASDVAHTMQHWHVYTQWNERLFKEMYSAYLHGRSNKDQSKGWYEGEIGFFDFYVIPLAKKLKECGVFGVASDEYLQCAIKNRREWEVKGKYVSEAMLTKFFDENADLVPP